MSRINSRSKGNRNERVAAELMSTWTKRKFSRTPSSGGLNWKSANSKGDVVCTAEGHFFPFCVEVKAHKDIDFSHLLNPKIKNIKILEFWEQCKRDAGKCNKIPLLLMRYDNMPSEFFFAVIDYEFYSKLNIFQKLLHVYTTFVFWDRKKKIKLTIMRSTEFFTLPYKEVKRVAKKFIHETNQ